MKKYPATKKMKWFSRKLIVVVVFNLAMGALAIFVPATAPAAIEAAKWITGIYVGAQAAQNAAGMLLGNKSKDAEE